MSSSETLVHSSEAAQRPVVLESLRTEVAGSVAPRILKRLETNPKLADTWQWQLQPDRWIVTTDTGERVTLVPRDSEISALDQISCTCLLNPRCLHLLAVLQLLPLMVPEPLVRTLDSGEIQAHHDSINVNNNDTLHQNFQWDISQKDPQQVSPSQQEPLITEQESAAESPEKKDGLEDPHPSIPSGPIVLTPAQIQAVRDLQDTVGRILYVGARGAGSLIQAALQRSIHSARACELPRAVTAAHRILQQLGNAPGTEGTRTTTALRSDLHELLDVCERLLRSPHSVTEHLIGEARRSYAPLDRLTLQGVLTWPITSITGYAGLVTLMLDTSGQAFIVADIKPANRAQLDLNGRIGIGDLKLTFRELSRSQLFLQEVRVSADMRIGLGKNVKASRGSESGWDTPLLQARFDVPAVQQLTRALKASALGPAEASEVETLLFLRATVAGATPGGILLQVMNIESDPPLVIESSIESRAMGQHLQSTLEILKEKPGLPLLLIAKPLLGMHRQVRLLGIAGDGRVRGPHRLVFPKEKGPHLSLNLERLDARWIKPDAPSEANSASHCEGSETEALDTHATANNPLMLIRRRLERCAQYGHSSLPISAGDEIEQDANRLSFLLMPGAAAGLKGLYQAARRPVWVGEEQTRAAFQSAWLTLSRYERAADLELSLFEWLGASRHR